MNRRYVNKVGTYAVLALTASLAAGGCDQGNEDLESRRGLLPIVASNVDGEEFLAGTYDARTGELWLTSAIQDGLVESVADSGASVLVVDEEGSAGVLDVAAGMGTVSPGLGPDADLQLLGDLDVVDPVEIGVLALREEAWIQTLSEDEAEVSFANCPEEWVGLGL